MHEICHVLAAHSRLPPIGLYAMVMTQLSAALGAILPPTLPHGNTVAIKRSVTFEEGPKIEPAIDNVAFAIDNAVLAAKVSIWCCNTHVCDLVF